jgi:hypothetical protein
MNQSNPSPTPTQDEVRAAAWAEVRNRWNDSSLRLAGTLAGA